MNRRNLLKAGAATGAAMSWSGCLGILGGGDDNPGGNDWKRVEEGENDNPDVKDYGFRIDFQDQTGTLGHVSGNYSTEDEYDTIVNKMTESDWAQLDNNDMNRAQSHMQDNDTSIEEIRPWVEKALNRELEEPQIESYDSPPGPEEPDERAIIYGIGKGINVESLISASLPAAEVIKPLTEKFTKEYLDEEAQMWIGGSAIPHADMKFVHSTMPVAYQHEGGAKIDLVEPSVPDTISGINQAIRDPQDSVYAADNDEFVAAFDYSKAQRLAKEGKIENGDRAIHPYRALSAAMTASLTNIVDSGANDVEMSEVPPNGILAAVSESFGNSIQDAYYNPTQEDVQKMENVGRAVQTFYNDRGWNAELGIGGTLDDPEIYKLNEDGINQAWEQYGEFDMSEFTKQHVGN